MSETVRVVVLYGGRSGEHEVSLASAASILAHLNPQKYTVIPVGMDKSGCFFVNDAETLRGYRDALPVKTAGSQPLPSLLRDGRFALDADVVFPVAHGPLYEDGCLQGMLELANIAYVGCGVLASAIGMHKAMARRLIHVPGVEVTPTAEVFWSVPADVRQSMLEHAIRTSGFPLFVKPCSMGSSVGIRKVHSMTELVEAVDEALRYDTSALIEAGVCGREAELSVLENEKPGGVPRVSVPGEIRVNHPDGFYSYRAKYLESDKTDLLVPAAFDAAMQQRLQAAARDIFGQLGCRGMARVDFFVDDENGRIFFNEINTIPGFTAISMYPRMWEASGLAYPDLLDSLIRLACMHHRVRADLVTHYQ